MNYQLHNNVLTVNSIECSSTDEFFSHFYISKKTRYLYYQEGLVRVNHNIVKGNTPLDKQASLQITMKKEEDAVVPCYETLSVCYEDDLFLMVDKPCGLIVHSDGVNTTHTLSNLVKGYYLSTSQNCPVRAIHRLDKETTGLVIFCKLPFFQPLLDHMLQEKEIDRQYYALCQGSIKQNQVTISQAIARDRHNAQKMRVSPSGKPSSTTVFVKQRFRNFTWIECHLHSGRTHQIRVHMAFLHHPLLSDTLYGTIHPHISRLALHAYRVRFVHPLLQQSLCIDCPLPKDIKSLLH